MDIQKLVRENIRNLQPYSSARDEFKGVADIYLDANENPFESDLNRYPDPLQKELKKKIAEIKNLSKEQIFLGNGSDEAIDLLIRIFCEPGQDEILILPPTYGMYAVSASISNVNIRSIPLQSNFQPDIEKILNATEGNVKMLFLCSPNNPTGNDFEVRVLEKLIAEFPGIVVVDEAYIDFSKRQSCTTWLKKYPNLVVLQTFSKAWGLAGIRLGMAFASKEIIDLLNKIKPPYNVNGLTQKIALQSLQIEKYKREVTEILAQRTTLKNELLKFDFVQKVYPSAANFLLVKVERVDELFHFLMDNGIIVRNRSKVPLCEGCLRFSVGTPAENQQLLRHLNLFKTSSSKTQN